MKATHIEDAMTLEQHMNEIGVRAKQAAQFLANASADAKNTALKEAANALRKNTQAILEANNQDMQAGTAKGLDAAMLDRLALNAQRIEAIAKGLEAIAILDDSVGQITPFAKRPNGLMISRMTVPLGVIGIIYESRPNVTADAGALCLKSGNAAILRGGSESAASSKAIVACLHEGLKVANIPTDAVQLLPTQDRKAVGIMLTMSDYIDVIVPRGGKGLCKRVQEESRVPTLLHLDGNCHTYVHEEADSDKAVKVIENAKLRRPGICGATESVVIDEVVATAVLPKLVDTLAAKECQVRGDEVAQTIDGRIVPASQEDWDMEYLDKILSVKIVADINEAIDFVNRHSSHHTDAIITENKSIAERFLKKIDSAIVMHNSSTQFADGGEFGMGAEIGISTGRLHARGPVGVGQLTTYKYLVESDGAVRG